MPYWRFSFFPSFPPCLKPFHAMQDPGLSIASLGATLLTPVTGFIATQPALIAQLAQANLIADVNAGLPTSLHLGRISAAYL